MQMCRNDSPALAFISTDILPKDVLLLCGTLMYLLNKASVWPDPSYCENTAVFLRICKVWRSRIPLPCMAKHSRLPEFDLIGRIRNREVWRKSNELNKLLFSLRNQQRRRSTTWFNWKTRYSYYNQVLFVLICSVYGKQFRFWLLNSLLDVIDICQSMRHIYDLVNIQSYSKRGNFKYVYTTNWNTYDLKNFFFCWESKGFVRFITL